MRWNTIRVYLVTSSGYYITGFNQNSIAFTNKAQMAHTFNEMPIKDFENIKKSIEDKLDGTLEVLYN